MTDILAIGDRTYSSWSLRGWLLFAAFGLPVEVRAARMYGAEFKALLAEFAPAMRVPAARIGGHTVWDSLAIAETLAERHPQAGHWPADPALRALARSMTAEMHAGFQALRGGCTMNLRHIYRGFVPGAEVLADIARIETLWATARGAAPDGPWLFGTYGAADAFFAPVVTRFVTYDLPASPVARGYIDAHLGHGPLRDWRAAGLAEGFVQPGYDLDLATAAWPA